MVGQRQEKLNGFSAATHQDWGGPVPKEYSGPWVDTGHFFHICPAQGLVF